MKQKSDRKIITLPHDSLRKVSASVDKITDKTRELVEDMVRLALEWEEEREHEVSVALAAVQIDCLQRVIIVRRSFKDRSDKHFHVYIDPEITKYEGDIVEDYEGCLSIKDVYGKVPRHSKVRIQALDLEGNPVKVVAKGFLARVFQHEIDHTKGTVFIDHIRDNSEAFFKLEKDGYLVALDYDKDVKNNKDLWE